MNRSTRIRPESADPFAMQLALSRVHARLVPMQRGKQGYAIDPSAEGWFELPAGRGFAGYGLGRALRMLLDILRGLTALHDTFDAEGVTFAHGEVALTQFRVDNDGVCRLIPLTGRHSSALAPTPPTEALGHLAPERLLGELVDPRADVFSAGVLLWEALAGRRLFSETTADAIIDRLMAEKLPMPQLPPELAWAIPLKPIAARALAVDPYQRFADCAELATAIAIVARERVATHAEIVAFFGSKVRSLNSVAQPRPIPTRSSTFPSLNLPVSPPFSVSAPPSSRNGFPLATPAPRSVTPAAPTSSARVPESRNVPTKSPFATLLGMGERVPASHRRKTLTSLGTPLSALGPIEAVPASAAPSTDLLPPLPLVWPASLPTAPTSQARTSSSAVVARATLESISLSAEEVATFRRWSSRRSLIALALLALASLVALIAIGGSGGAPDNPTTHAPNHVRDAAPGAVALRAAAAEPAANSDDPARREPTPASATDPGNGAPSGNAKERGSAAKGASPTKPVSTNTKDYGI